MSEICYSANGENYEIWEESVIERVLESAFATEKVVVVGDKFTYYEADAVDYTPGDFITDWRIENFLEDLNCAAQDEAGEAAEDFAYYVGDEAHLELKTFLKEWANKHLEATFYGVKNVREKELIITQEILDEWSEPNVLCCSL